YTPPPVYMPPPLFNWTGFYVGGNFGGAWNHQNVTDSMFGLNFSNASNNGAFMGGGQVGFNYQFSNIVLGVEWDIDWVGNNDNTNSGIGVLGIGPIQVSSNNGWITTLAGRFGVAYDTGSFMAKLVVVGSATVTSPLPMRRPALRSPFSTTTPTA